MRTLILLFFVLLCCSDADAQLTSGLVAHWRFNGNANDASGHSLNGVAFNTTSVAGKYGVANTAMQFTGDTNSYVIVPYQNVMNVSKFSICAVVKPKGFYTALCQIGAIVRRGTQYQAGAYSLDLSDNTHDSTCNVTGDTSFFAFSTEAAGVNGYHKPWDIPPYVHTNTWYCIIVTYDSSAFRVYREGSLVTTIYPPTNPAIGNSTESLTIGGNRYGNFQTYPYNFKGVIDDIRIYNRALADSEASAYCNIVDIVTSVGDLETPMTLTLFPNPNSGSFLIEGETKTNTPVSITVLNAIGQPVHIENVKPVSGFMQKEIRLNSELPNGMYIVRIRAGEMYGMLKFTLQR